MYAALTDSATTNEQEKNTTGQHSMSYRVCVCVYSMHRIDFVIYREVAVIISHRQISSATEICTRSACLQVVVCDVHGIQSKIIKN